MQAANRVAKNTLILYGRMAITIFISLYSTRLILNALGINDFGIFNVVGGAVSMLLFFNNAMTGASQRFMSFAEGAGDIQKQKKIFNVSLVLHIITAFLVVLLLETVGYYLFEGVLNISPKRIESAKIIFHFLVVSTFFTVLSVPYDAVINAHENMSLVAVLGIAESILKLVIALYISTATGDKLIIYGLLMALLSILMMVVRQIYCHLKYDEVIISIQKYFDKPLFKEMTSFASWSLLGCSSSMIGTYGNGIVLNVFFGSTINAAQGIANQISGQLGAFASTMLKALNPLIAKSEGSGNRDFMLNAAMVGSKISFFLLMFFVIPAFVELPYIFKIWLKTVPDYAIIFCRIYLIKNLIDQLFVTLNSVVAAVGNIKRHQMIVSFLFILPLIITYFCFYMGFPPYSLYIIGIFFSLFSGIFNVYYANVYCKLPTIVFLKKVCVPCIVSFLGIFCISLLPAFFIEEGIIRLVVVLISSLVSFVFFTWLVGLSKTERYYLKVFYKGVVQKIILKLN